MHSVFEAIAKDDLWDDEHLILDSSGAAPARPVSASLTTNTGFYEPFALSPTNRARDSEEEFHAAVLTVSQNELVSKGSKEVMRAMTNILRMVSPAERAGWRAQILALRGKEARNTLDSIQAVREHILLFTLAC